MARNRCCLKDASLKPPAADDPPVPRRALKASPGRLVQSQPFHFRSNSSFWSRTFFTTQDAVSQDGPPGSKSSPHFSPTV